MWQIVKNELSYHKFILIFGCITVALFGNATKFGFERFDLSEMAWMVFLGAYTVIYTKSQEEKRNQYFARLPLPVKSIGLARITVLYLVFFGLLVLNSPDHLTWKALTEDLRSWTVLLGNILILIAYTLALIVADIHTIRNRKYRTLFWVSVASYALLMTTLVTTSLIYYNQQSAPYWGVFLFKKPIIPVLLSLLPIPILFHVSIAAFMRRKSYFAA